VAAVVVTLIMSLTAPGVAAAAPRQPAPGEAAITPGALMISPLGAGTASACTAAFVFSGTEGTYLGYAAHCASTAGTMGLSGCEEEPLPLGSTVVIERSDGSQARGRLAYSSWITMQERDETDRALCLFNDFALVELAPDDVDAVDPTVPFLGGPTGLDTGGTRRGEPVYSYQPNNEAEAVKVGVSLGTSANGLTHRVDTTPPGVPGDSGSGYLDSEGQAFGVLSTEFLDERRTNGVADLASALGYANRYGDLGQVSLVRGTEPFTPPQPGGALSDP
jgi:hypothetical protein